MIFLMIFFANFRRAGRSSMPHMKHVSAPRVTWAKNYLGYLHKLMGLGRTQSPPPPWEIKFVLFSPLRVLVPLP